jgi:hypothetical protein
MNIPTITLDQIAAIQHVVSFNELANAMSSAVLFGVKQRETNGLRLALYGGVFPADAGPVQIADQHIVLTASTTNYVYVDAAGTVSKVTTMPVGWPGPMSTGYRALYELTVGTNAITSGTCYIVGAGSKGATGTIGATGAQGSPLWKQRRRIFTTVGGGMAGHQSGSLMGFEINLLDSGPQARTPDATSCMDAIPQTAVGAGSATDRTGGYSGQRNFCTRGAVAGAGGFEIAFRWGIDATYMNNNDLSSFVGLYDFSAGDPADSSGLPGSLLNLVGVGCAAGDATLSLVHNDASGTATFTTLYCDESPAQTFPARDAETTYELVLSCVSEGSSIAYSLRDICNDHISTGTVTTDMPAATVFLGWLMMVNNNSIAANTFFNFMQVAAYSRY